VVDNETSVTFGATSPSGKALLNSTFDTFSVAYNLVETTLWYGNTTIFGNDSMGMGMNNYPGEFDTRDYPYPLHIEKRPLWEILVKSIFIIVIIVLALVGNILVVYIVWRNKRMRSTTNCFIVNLAVSDIMVTISCTWVRLVDDLTEGWVLGGFFCKFNSFAQGWILFNL